jgi:hypothetical protein
MADDCIQANVYIVMQNPDSDKELTDDNRVVKVNDNAI